MKRNANLLAGAAGACVGALALLTMVPFAVSVCILVFKLTGWLADGPMYFDLDTPGYAELLTFQGACAVILTACWLARAKLTWQAAQD